ncbi:MAG: glycosyltransferase family 9 protein [Cyclobacteriaceae bacterium]
MKVLLLRFSSIGDIVLTTPVIRALKTNLDNPEIHYATKSKYAMILAENPYVDKIHELGSSLNALIKQLKSSKFDYIIDLHNNLRTWQIKQRLGVKSSTYSKLNFQKWLLVNLKVDLMPNKHIVDRYLATLEPLNIVGDTLGLDHFIPEKDEVDINWLPGEFKNGYVAIVIGATYATKKLPLPRLIELCDRINQPVVLIGGQEDQEVGNEISRFFERTVENEQFESTLQKDLGKRASVFNACGKFNFNQSASLIKQASLVFTHDTGMMHIAAAFKKKVYSIWGSTTPSFGMYPYRTQYVVFENKNLSCRPCSKIGHNKCPKGHFKCMKNVVFDFYLPS